MKLVKADKFIDFIKDRGFCDSGRFGNIVNIDELFSFISTNSIEVEEIKPKGVVEINDEIMEREYENYLDAIYIHKADVKDKLIAERIHQDIKAEQAYMEQVNVKTTEKSCENCEHNEENENITPDICVECIANDKVDRTNWTPKADKVEGEI